MSTDDDAPTSPEDVEPTRWIARCPDVRPCQVECRHRLPIAAPYSCALDAAAGGAMTLERIGDHLGLTRERVRQLEAKALQKLVDRMRRAGLDTSPQWRALLRDIDVEDDGKRLRATEDDEEGAVTLEELATMPRLARLAVLRAQRPRGRGRAA